MPLGFCLTALAFFNRLSALGQPLIYALMLRPQDIGSGGRGDILDLDRGRPSAGGLVSGAERGQARAGSGQARRAIGPVLKEHTT